LTGLAPLRPAASGLSAARHANWCTAPWRIGRLSRHPLRVLLRRFAVAGQHELADEHIEIVRAWSRKPSDAAADSSTSAEFCCVMLVQPSHGRC
jgi:hypothetical protein